MKREIVKIDENLCNGCGICIPNCHEGALQIIDNKARLVSELSCDGLGACIGHCPQGAIKIETREAEPYNETAVLESMLNKGLNTIKAHLIHLKDHNEDDYIKEGISFLEKKREILEFDLDKLKKEIFQVEEKACKTISGGSCPGSLSKSFENSSETGNSGSLNSELTHWPVQLHLINPIANHYKNCDLLLAADCTAFAAGNFHSTYLKNKKLAIACPKLDSSQDIYEDKLIQLIEVSIINTLTVLIMQVPCCRGLLQTAINATKKARRKVPVKTIIIDHQGNKISEDWIN